MASAVEASPTGDRSAGAENVTAEPCAWAYWLRWNGGVELIQRAARAAVWAARDAGVDRPRCRIDVLVGEDTESFESPEDFRANVTGDALLRFERISIAVGGGQPPLAISLSIVRADGSDGASPADALPRGVHLGVSTDASRSLEQRAAIRGAVIAAVDRGAGGATALKGDTEDGQMARDAVHEYLHPAQPPVPGWTTAALAVLGAGAVLLFVLASAHPEWFDGFLTERRLELNTGDPSRGLFTVSYVPNSTGIATACLAFLVPVQVIWRARGHMNPAPEPAAKIAGVHGMNPLRGALAKLADHAIAALITLLIGFIALRLGLSS